MSPSHRVDLLCGHFVVTHIKVSTSSMLLCTDCHGAMASESQIMEVGWFSAMNTVRASTKVV